MTQEQVRILRDTAGVRTQFEELEIGKDLGTQTLRVTQSQIDQLCERMEDHHPYYELTSPFGTTIAPLSSTYLITRGLFSQTYSVRGLFYRWAVDLLAPIRPDVEYSVIGTLSDKWVKNEREFVAYEAVYTDPVGNVVMTTKRAHVLDFIKRTAPKVGEGVGTSDARSEQGRAARQPYWDPNWPSDRTAANTGTIEVDPIATASTPVGAPLPTVSLFFHRERFIARQENWLVGRSRNLHVDDSVAKMEGLPGAVASAPDLMAMIHQSALHFFGAGWVSGGKADLYCVRPTYVNDYVTAKGLVTSIENLADGSKRLHCDVWVENQSGEKKISGKLSGIVGSK